MFFIDIHVSFLSDSADKTKRVASTNSACVHEYLCSVRLLRRLTALECGQWWEKLTSHNFCCGNVASWHLGCCEGEMNLHQRSVLNCNHISSSCPRWTWLKWTTAQLFEMMAALKRNVPLWSPCNERWLVLHPDPVLTSDVLMPCKCKWW